MSVKKSREYGVYWGGSKVGNLTDFSVSVDGEVINISDFDSGDWNDKLAGRKDWTMDLSLYHNPEDDTVQATLGSDMFTSGRSDTIAIKKASPSSGDVELTGTGILGNMSWDGSGADEALTSSFSVEGNGELTRNVTA